MDSTLMLRAASSLFLIAALGGLVMAAIRLIGKHNPPAWLAMAHGLLAGAGLTLLIYAALVAGISSMAMTALVLFLIAAGGGLVMNLKYEWKRELLPAPLLAVHALLAVVAFVLLLDAAWA